MRILIFLLALCWTIAAFAQAPITRTPQQVGESLVARHAQSFAKVQPRVASTIAGQRAAITNMPILEPVMGPKPGGPVGIPSPSNTICPIWLDVCNPNQ